ncbi:hypothetical protein [Microbacterium sp. 1262]|uniref:hypothetical protein n=1 Tax=Microbacterium sp. 1262 TaxID=3156415 RepID=UPI003390B8C1
MTNDDSMAFATWLQVAASLLSIVLALAGLWIAVRVAREQRNNRDFQLDRELADEFGRRLDKLLAELQRGRIDVTTASLGYRDALREWASRATHTSIGRERREIESFLTDIEMSAARGMPASRQERADVLAALSYSGAFHRAQHITRAWSYPEQRRDVLTTVLRDRAAAMPNPRSSPDVQAQRWLLVSDPHSWRTIRAFRTARVYWLMALDDIRRKRVRQSVREWTIERRGERAERAAFKRQQRAARAGLTIARPDRPE